MFFSKIKVRISKKQYIIGLSIILFILAIYIPALDNYLLRDDFEWLNESYGAIENPSVLFKTISNFFRPMVKLSYLFNHFFFDTDYIFFNITSIFFHLLNVFLLFFLIVKNIPPSNNKNIIIAIIASLGFGTSPMYSEITLWAAGRPDSILLIFMLATLLLFTKLEEGEKLSIKDQILVFLFVIGASFSKESWVLLPFLIFSFLFIIKKIKFLSIVKKLIPIFSLLFFYLIYFIGLPLFFGKAAPTNYSNASIESSIKKFSFLIYKYAGMEDLFTGKLWEFFLIIIILIGLSFFFIYRKNRMALWGITWMIITISISLQIHTEVPPSRYNYLPLIGFWIMIAAFLIEELDRIVKKVNSKIIHLLAGLLFVLFIVHQVIMVQWEIKDYRFQSTPYKQLSQMYIKVKNTLPKNKPIIFIDMGQRKAVDEAVNSMKGYRKLLYARGSAIWQLVFISPLHNFLSDPYNEIMELIPKKDIPKALSKDFLVLTFSDSAFTVNNSYKDRILAYYKKYKKLPYKVQAVRINRKKKIKQGNIN